MDHDLTQHESTSPSPSEGAIGMDGWLDLHASFGSIYRNNVFVASNDGTRAQDRVLLSPCGGGPSPISQGLTICHPGGNIGVGLAADDQDRYRTETTTMVLEPSTSDTEPGGERDTKEGMGRRLGEEDMLARTGASTSPGHSTMDGSRQRKDGIYGACWPSG